jgi:hypothetical protein
MDDWGCDQIEPWQRRSIARTPEATRSASLQLTESRQSRARCNAGTAAWMSITGVTSNSKNGTHGVMPSMIASAESVSTIPMEVVPGLVEL